MTETYATKRARRLKLREAFPVPLQGIPLRQAEAVAALPESTRNALAEAVSTGIKNLSYVIEYARENPTASMDTLVEAANASRVSQKSGAGLTELGAATMDRLNVETLIELLERCYPKMPPQSAQALAESDIMAEILDVVRSMRNALASSHARSDFVIIVLFELASQTTDRIAQLIQSNPAFLQAIRQSGSSWES